MAIRAVIGRAQALDGRDAAVQAVRRALEQVGRDKPALAFVVASHHYPIQLVAAGVASEMGDIPLFGFSTLGEICDQGYSQRTVIVALLCGDVQARADWWSGYAEDSRTVTNGMAQAFQLNRSSGLLLLAADGVNGDAQQLCDALPAGKYQLFGSLAGGDIALRRTYQMGGRKSGVNGLAAALITGEKLATGIGAGHGWVSMGQYLPVTQSADLWLKAVNQHSPAELYAQWLGYTPDEWRIPPLSYLARLYPLGVRVDREQPPIVRSPLCVEEADGSLQMHTTIPEGSEVCLMIGSSQACLEAAEEAARQALIGLGGLKPVLALVLVDFAWQMLMQAEPGAEIAAVQRILGDDTPLIGGYTLGQFIQGQRMPKFLNQHIAVLLFAEA
jgi:hypothetical protein